MQHAPQGISGRVGDGLRGQAKEKELGFEEDAPGHHDLDFSPIIPGKGWRGENRQQIERLGRRRRPHAISLLDGQFVAAMGGAAPFLAGKSYGRSLVKSRNLSPPQAQERYLDFARHDRPYHCS